MSDDLRCAVAMLFRQSGRRSMSEKEFLFGASIDLRWLPYPQAQKMLDAAKAAGLVKMEGEALKPTFEVSSVEIPVGFRPDKDMLSKAAPPAPTEEGLLPRLLNHAEDLGMSRRDFIAQCNRVQDRMDVDIEVASLLILAEKGADVAPYLDEAESLIRDR